MLSDRTLLAAVAISARRRVRPVSCSTSPVGGEGRGYTDENGNFIPRRRPRSDPSDPAAVPLFPGDALVDELPTLTDIYHIPVRARPVEVATRRPASANYRSRMRTAEPAGSMHWTASRDNHQA